MAEIRPEFRMFHDPEFGRPEIRATYPPELVSLWLEALARPEADMQRKAGATLVRGLQSGIPGLEAGIPRFRELLTAADTHHASRCAAARALIALNARVAVDDLANAASRFPGDVRQICERALGDWKYEPIQNVWLERLNDPVVGHRDLVLAIGGLGLGEVESASTRLRELVHDLRTPLDLRIESAIALGRIRDTNWRDDALALLERTDGPVRVNHLCAVRILDRQTSPEAQSLLLRLATNPEPVVAGSALRLLNQIDSNLVVPLAEQAMLNADPGVRREGLLAYTRHPTPERVVPVSRLLNDLMPDLRREVTGHLGRLLAEPALEPAIWQAVLDVLGQEAWRGQEQAALLVGEFEHRPASGRLLELQSAPRGESRVAAAWALRKLAIRETCPAILRRAEELTKLRLSGQRIEMLDEQVGHLFEALAVMEYWEAEPLWRQYVPKNPPLGQYSRATAVWALGVRYNGTSQPQLAQQFVERLTDTDARPPLLAELEFVRYASAISIARVKGKAQVPAMIEWVNEDHLRSGNLRTDHALAVRWALEQLTGERFAELLPIPVGNTGWYLEPIGKE